MANEEGVLREFLVSLGFRVDLEQHRKFQRGLQLSTEEVGKLGLAIGSVSTALAAGMERIADQFASLYYTSQLTGATVQNLRDLGFAAGQVGTNAEAMTQALRNAHILLQSPGGEAEIRAFTGYTGAITSSTQAVDILMRHWKMLYDNGQAWLARQQEQVLGFNSTALEPYILNLDRANAAVAEHQRRWAAIDQEKLSKDAVELGNAWRSLSDEILYWPTLFTARFIGPATEGIKWLTDELADIRKEFEGLDKDTQDWILAAGGVATALVGWKTATTIIGGLARAFGLVETKARAAAVAEREAAVAATGPGGLRSLLSIFTAIEAARAVAQAKPEDLDPNSPASKKKQDEVWNRWFGWTGIKNDAFPSLGYNLDPLGAIERWWRGGSQNTAPDTGPVHRESYRVLGGEGGGLFHEAAYRVPAGVDAPPWLREAAYSAPAGDAGPAVAPAQAPAVGPGSQAAGDLQDWLRGSGAFIPTVRIVDDTSGAGMGPTLGSFGFGLGPQGAAGPAGGPSPAGPAAGGRATSPGATGAAPPAAQRPLTVPAYGTPLPGARPGAVSAETEALAERLYLHARSPLSAGGLGLDAGHALAILGNAFAESRLNPRAVGDHGTSIGLFQEHNDRGAAMLRALGAKALDPQAQFDYAVREQQQRDPNWFRQPGSYKDLTNSFEGSFERPARLTDRSGYADAILGAINKATLGAGDTHRHEDNRHVEIHAPVNVTVHGAADGHHIAETVHRRHQRTLGDAVRNLAPVAT